MPPDLLDQALKAAEIVVVGSSAAAVFYKLGRVTEKFEQIGLRQAAEITDMKLSIDKLETTVNAVALQDQQIQTLREQQLTNQKRQDETNNRIFAILDRLRHNDRS